MAVWFPPIARKTWLKWLAVLTASSKLLRDLLDDGKHDKQAFVCQCVDVDVVILRHKDLYLKRCKGGLQLPDNTANKN